MKNFSFMKYLVASVGIMALDLGTKKVVSQKIPLGETVELIEEKVHLTHLKNKGAAMGFLEEYPVILGIFSVVAMIWTAFTFGKTFVDKGSSFFSKAGAASILGGALGNMIDRYRNRSVTDFIYFPFLKRSPVFNFADLFIFLGAIGYGLGMALEGWRDFWKLW